MDSSSLPGHYFDGLSGSKRAAEVRRDAAGFLFRVANGPLQQWPEGSWRAVVDPSFREVRIEKLPYTGECLIVEDSALARSLSAGGSINKILHSRRLPALAGLAAASAAFVALIILGYPQLTTKVALTLPVSLEERLGAAFSSSLASARTQSPSIDAAVSTLVLRLSRGPSSYKWRVMITTDGSVNAWAAPGGYIGINGGLVCAMDSPDQLAAVLAHEMSHATARHSTRNLVRMLGVRLGLALLFGGGDSLLDTATMLGALSYMRADEEEADRDALKLLVRSRVDPISMVQAFERLASHSPEVYSALNYLSTHPPLAQRRSAALKAASSARGASPQPWTPALTQSQWQRLREACNCGD